MRINPHSWQHCNSHETFSKRKKNEYLFFLSLNWIFLVWWDDGVKLILSSTVTFGNGARAVFLTQNFSSYYGAKLARSRLHSQIFASEVQPLKQLFNSETGGAIYLKLILLFDRHWCIKNPATRINKLLHREN